jgi:hypothetical protein
MKTLEIKTGMIRVELERFYINLVNKLIAFGLSEDKAREIVQETLKETLGL